jgi:hypothetical protein
MKRTTTLLVAMGLVFAFPATALAGKPAPPTVDVTITGNIDTTACSTGPLTMDYGDKGTHALNAGSDTWAHECVYLTLNGLDPGCYCGYHQDNEDPTAFAGVFRLVEQRDGTVELTSQFDRLWVVTYLKNGKPRSVLNSAYSLLGILDTPDDATPFDWTQASGGGTLTGDLVLQSFFKEVGSVGGTWTEISTTPVAITVSW